jgi:DNA-binding NtrC family response regulator
MGKDYLRGKRILVVDDEPDIPDVIEESLPMAEVVKVYTFADAKEMLETRYFDVAILDIMGVNGYKLLDIANGKKVVAVMLTAHALSPEDTVKSYKEGAASFIPKEEMVNIATFLNDVFEAKEKGKNLWWRWFDRFASLYDKRFGPDWQKKDGEFWDYFVESAKKDD